MSLEYKIPFGLAAAAIRILIHVCRFYLPVQHNLRQDLCDVSSRLHDAEEMMKDEGEHSSSMTGDTDLEYSGGNRRILNSRTRESCYDRRVEIVEDRGPPITIHADNETIDKHGENVPQTATAQCIYQGL